MALNKIYNPGEVEEKWFKFWDDNDQFSSYPNDKKPYTIVIPPPNVTGILHMGHMLNNTIQDILIRKARLDGMNACWVPGTDHASIATEAKVVNMLKEKNIDKHSISRTEFLDHAWKWTHKHGGIILDQLKRIGCSCDWNRTKFTLDEDMSESVIDVFIKLYNDGFIYREKKMVNWDPEARTTLSNEEVNYKEVDSTLYHLKYPIKDSDDFLVIATTRPETIFGDTAIAVNSKDIRYKKLIGKNVIVPICNNIIPIISSELVDKEFGTGCLKVTPAHSETDFIIGEQNDLEIIDVFNPDGTLNSYGLHYEGMDRFVVRKKIVKELDEKKLLVETKNYKHNVAISERTSCVVEPKISTQWFVKMKDLSKPALKSVLNNEIKFHPKKYVNTYKYWMDNIRDWNISRQLYWGHRIPVYYLKNDSSKYVVAKNIEEAVVNFKNKEINITIDDIVQDNDVLDTWFSSWLWPISVFDGVRNPNNEEINYYYPTSTVVTGPDIIFFWIARMVVSGYMLKDQKPFENVYFTGIVRDNQRRKMSKQLGNSPDPIQLINKYGADSVRIGLLFSAPAGNDLLFDENLCVQGRNFSNKIWNAYRLIEGFNISDSHSISDHSEKALLWFENRLQFTLKEINSCFEKFRISDALMIIYKLVWDDFCSIFLEIVKPSSGEAISKKSAVSTKKYFSEILTILHPFMPFLTEELFSEINKTNRSISDEASWPKFKKTDINFINDFDHIIDVVSNIRKFKKTKNISFKEEFMIYHDNHIIDNGFASVVHKLTGCKIVYSSKSHDELTSVLVGKYRYYFDYKEEMSLENIKELEKSLEYHLGFKMIIEKKLSNDKFVNNAPENVIQNERKKLEDVVEKIRLIKETLKNHTN